MALKIILYQPQIPQNTGNIIRTCCALNMELILVRPLGFSTSSRMMKRAGLDYLENVSIREVDDIEEVMDDNCYFFSSKGSKSYTTPQYTLNSSLVFGSETNGLPDHLFEKYSKNFVRIPMVKNARCLNLSNTVAIGAYEVMRRFYENTLVINEKINATAAPDTTGI